MYSYFPGFPTLYISPSKDFCVGGVMGGTSNIRFQCLANISRREKENYSPAVASSTHAFFIGKETVNKRRKFHFIGAVLVA